MSTSEIDYTSYARVNIARTTGGWAAASGGIITPAANSTSQQEREEVEPSLTLSFGKTGGGATAILF